MAKKATVFEKSLAKTAEVRSEVPKDLLPLFDHLGRLALDSHSHGYAKRAGRELAAARKLAGK